MSADFAFPPFSPGRALQGLEALLKFMVKYGFSPVPSNNKGSIPTPNNKPRKPLKMSFCIRGNNSNTLLGFRLRDATGRIWQQNLTTIDFEGWRTIEVDIKPAGYAWGGKSRPDNGFTYPITLLEFTLDLKPDKPYYKTKGKIILDEFLFYERQYENF